MTRNLLAIWIAGLVLWNPGWAAEPEKPVEIDRDPAAAAVARLGSLDFREREAASRELWELGAGAVDELSAAVASPDPEVSRRARILLDRIRAGIGPDTPKEVVELVQGYGVGGPNERVKVIERLRAQRAFVQMIRLFHFEEDADVRSRCGKIVNAVVLPAVRDFLNAGDVDGALALLRVSPDSPEKFRRLAALFRVRGTLDEEIAALQGRADPGERPLLLACHLAQGDLEEALVLARAQGLQQTVASLSALAGDPVPYLDWFLGTPDLGGQVRMHVEMCYERWHGREADARSLLRPMLTAAREDGDEDGLVSQALFLNGYVEEGVRALAGDPEYRKALEIYYDGVERPERVLELYEYPADADGRQAWVDERVAAATRNWDFYGRPANELLGLIGLFAERGKRDEAYRMIQPLALAAREDGLETWSDFLTVLGSRAGEHLEIGFRLVRDDADDDPVQAFANISNLMVYWESNFDDFSTGLRFRTQLRRLWDDLGEAAEWSLGERVMALGEILGVVHAPPARVAELSDLLRGQARDARRPAEGYESLVVAALLRGDVAVLPGLLQRLVDEPGGDRWRYHLLEQHTFRHDWEKADELWQEFLKENEGRVEALSHSAQRLVVAMRLGRTDEVSEIVSRIETLHLDEPGELAQLALFLEAGGLWDEAARYWRRLLMTSQPFERTWHFAVDRYLRDVKNRGDWEVAAALAQVDVVGSQMDSLQMRSYGPWFALRKHFNLSFYRALVLLEKGEQDEARQLLDRAVGPISGDGVLADDFFPILRQEGHTELHDHYFEACFAQMKESLKQFPDAHNTHNSLAWLASRANRRLDEAEKHSAKALEMRPRQAAYLDTMAEVWFARGDRKKALEWSLKSMEDAQHGGHTRSGGGAELRAQHDRFLTGEFPAP